MCTFPGHLHPLSACLCEVGSDARGIGVNGERVGRTMPSVISDVICTTTQTTVNRYICVTRVVLLRSHRMPYGIRILKGKGTTIKLILLFWVWRILDVLFYVFILSRTRILIARDLSIDGFRVVWRRLPPFAMFSAYIRIRIHDDNIAATWSHLVEFGYLLRHLVA